jgi:hypothetical protein
MKYYQLDLFEDWLYIYLYFTKEDSIKLLNYRIQKKYEEN